VRFEAQRVAPSGARSTSGRAVLRHSCSLDQR
jgi:hypothetical protein